VKQQEEGGIGNRGTDKSSENEGEDIPKGKRESRKDRGIPLLKRKRDGNSGWDAKEVLEKIRKR